jgi:hypothetical protein
LPDKHEFPLFDGRQAVGGKKSEKRDMLRMALEIPNLLQGRDLTTLSDHDWHFGFLGLNFH